ncbi:MAG: TonB-dependent receptor [Ketobacter sp.]|nr:MAG: TonB-dependent receptor [Ketobacter sp.]
MIGMLVGRRVALGIGGSMLVLSQASAATSPTLQQEIRWLQEEHYVTTATKTQEKLNKSGSTISIITADELQKMGARNLMDALKRVPGFGINQFNMGITSTEVRGVKTDFSEKVLFLINGHPVNNNLVNGGALSSYNNFRIDDIKVVEIVRGPGSALYGANAFVAVVNIVTKTAKDIDGVELSLSGGSDETNQFDLLYGERIGELDLAFNANVFHSDGINEPVRSDATGQSGRTDFWQKRYEMSFQGSYRNLSLQGRYTERKAGAYLGANNFLNTGSEQEYREYFIDGSYVAPVSDNLSVMTHVYFDHFEFDNLWELADNFYARSPIKHDKTGIESTLTWNWNSNNKLLLGAAAEHQSQYGVEYWTNNGAAELVNISDVANWNGSHNRDIVAVYMQDIWDVMETLRLIVGARYDHYSDFEGSFNPRASLSWEFVPDYHLIATYGSAFRAPTFGELYNINNPSIVGNPDLHPEEIDTIELGLNIDISRRFQVRGTFFYNNIQDIIAPRASQGAVNSSGNVGELEVLGVELEAKLRLRNGSTLGSNYTYQDPTNALNDTRAPEVPLQRANLWYNHRFSRSLNAFAGVLYESKLSREEADPRADVPATTTLDLALTWRNSAEDITITTSLYNALDAHHVDPSPSGVMLSDYPNPGRSFMLELQFEY